jgi:ABC-type glutathione transport system ATPase component
MSVAKPVVEVERLRKVFEGRRTFGEGKHAERVAVDDVSFIVREGGALAIVGESGSGKTTVARMLAGLEVPTAGRIQIQGEDWSVAARRVADRRRRAQALRIVFQDPYRSLDPLQTAGACLDEVLALHMRGDATARKARILEVRNLVGLSERHMRALPRELSGGERQRVALARALAVEPAVLVLDEPVAALDVSIQAQILNVLADIHEKTGIVYILISHDLGVVRQVADQVLVMQRGCIVERGETSEVLNTPTHPYTRLLRDCVPRPGWTPTRQLGRLAHKEET